MPKHTTRKGPPVAVEVVASGRGTGAEQRGAGDESAVGLGQDLPVACDGVPDGEGTLAVGPHV